MFNELYDKKSIFRNKYMENLINRFTNASLSVEGVNGDLADTMQALNIYQQTQALEYAFSIKKDENININNIKKIENILTGEEISNFRTTSADVYGSKVSRSKPAYIYMDLYTLFDNYYNIWKDLDPFLREAYFHIRFLHIHPFEDGNGRTARILLIRNLCANGQVPCVITKETKAEYCSYIENNDAEGLANFFRKISDKELNTILNLYKILDSKGLIKDNKMTKKQEKEYNKIIGQESNKIENNFPLRNVENLISLFKYSQLPKETSDELQKIGLCRFERIFDNNSGDVAVYYEDKRVMSISIKDDLRYFKIIQKVDKLYFEIDGIEVLPQEFEYELNHKPIRISENEIINKTK